MVQLIDDCFALGGELLTVAAALELLRRNVFGVTGSETVPLKESRGRVLARPLIATRDVPPHDNCAVDGYAVRFDDLSLDSETLLPVTGRVAAGHPLGRAVPPGEAVRIFTGAPLPDGVDTVAMQEDCVAENGKVHIPAGIERGANCRKAGDDVKAGAEVLHAGRRLRPQEIGLAASLGLTALDVRCRLRVALLSTGDEVHEPGAPIPPGGIYDSNRFTLYSLLEALGAEIDDVGIVPDRAEAVRDAIAGAARDHDLIVTSGGMSTGEEDHLKAAVQSVGRLHFWRLAIKPGRPVAMGQVGAVPFIGLPGNPVAAMVSFLLLARPLVLRLQGAEDVSPRRYRVTAGFDYKRRGGRREFIRARLVPGRDGEWIAQRFPREGSNILTSMVDSDGLVEIGENLSSFAIGARIAFLPFAEALD